MALNSFFLQGSSSEQRLVQELINEQLKMFGIEIVYIPRKFVRKETILKEISSSKFDESFSIEAYLDNYDGYTGQGDILTKFGVSLKDELSLIISRERFETFIGHFLSTTNSTEFELSSRPREGDLVYFPLGKRLFEVKFVEHESPFYQLGKLYVYQLKCELFEYEDEVIDTSISEIDARIEDEGYIATLNLISLGSTATAAATIGSGYIKKIDLTNDGFGYTSAPTISITPAPLGGTNANAIAILSTVNGPIKSIKEILLAHAGIGYTEAPEITITGGGGSGATATCEIEKLYNGVVSFTLDDLGSGYATKPIVSIAGPIGIGETALSVSSLNGNGQVTSIKISNPGIGYTQIPKVTIAPPSIISGFGSYIYNEIVTGSVSGTTARVKSWNAPSKILKVSFINISDTSLGFYPGETIVGSMSSAVYAVADFDTFDNYDKYSDSATIQIESDQILDFSESNPFGFY